MRIFLSSTYIDLVEHRQAVTNALERLGQQVGRMEIFGARPAEPLIACMSEIDECDLFVGIYAHRYGYMPPGSRYSITEQEFRRARKQAKPLFCFLVEDLYDWPLHLVEAELGSSKLLTFKSHIKKTLVVDFFREPLDLAVKVATAVGRYLIGHSDLLVIRSEDAAIGKQRKELITLLETRKPSVLSALGSNAASKKQFLRLHARNIEAIRNGELLLSYLLTSDIHLLINSIVIEQQRSVVRGKSKDTPSASPQRRERELSWIGFNLFEARSEFLTLYPYNAQFSEDRKHHEWGRSSGWYSRNNPPRETGSDETRQPSGSWRDQLLDDWLRLELKPIQTALTEHRRIAALERDASARGMVKARLRPNGTARCPHCDARIVTSAKVGEQERCPECLTYIELVEQVVPTEYQGHQMLEGICMKCGGSLKAIRHFGFKCK